MMLGNTIRTMTVIHPAPSERAASASVTTSIAARDESIAR
jgi:hypothetical protein